MDHSKEPRVIRLERSMLATSRLLPDDMPFVRNHLSIETTHHTEIHAALITLRTYLLKSSHRKMETAYVNFPASWWQHFKQAHFPAWLKKCFPVMSKATGVTYERTTNLCPHGDFAWPHSTHLDFLTYGDLPWTN